MPSSVPPLPADVETKLRDAANSHGLDVSGGKIRRSSSRFCLGVEHGDYNGTELFGVGTDRFIWIAYKPNETGRLRLFSCNVPDDGIIDFELGKFPEADNPAVAQSWGRFPYGVNAILQEQGYELTAGMDAVIYGNIPGGGMSRSASLALNLVITVLEVNEVTDVDGMRVVELAQMVENDYIGSPCGNLDQIMIYFAREGMGTYYAPATGKIEHVPLGDGAEDFRIVSLDTGTNRPGLEKSTYKIRREECEQLVALATEPFGIKCLGDVNSHKLYESVSAHFAESHPNLCQRLKYIFEAQQRFDKMLAAWRAGDVRKVGKIFRADGYGLRDDYVISGVELEAMCDIARTVDGVLGERMLGGGDKGASGAIVLAEAVDALRSAVDEAYPKQCPDFADSYAVHACQTVNGIVELPGL